MAQSYTMQCRLNLSGVIISCWEVCAVQKLHRPKMPAFWRWWWWHKRRSSVNFGGRHFSRKCMYEKLTKCPNFTWYLPEKNVPEFLGVGGQYMSFKAAPRGIFKFYTQTHHRQETGGERHLRPPPPLKKHVSEVSLFTVIGWRVSRYLISFDYVYCVGSYVTLVLFFIILLLHVPPDLFLLHIICIMFGSVSDHLVHLLLINLIKFYLIWLNTPLLDQLFLALTPSSTKKNSWKIINNTCLLLTKG